MTEYPATRLKVMALRWLRSRYPDALLTTELAVAKYGDALLDVAAIMPTEIVGVEIKGDGDSPIRLERQGWVYSRCATQMFLLPAPSLRDRCLKHRPRMWGMLDVNGDEASVRLDVYGEILPNAPAALLGILWRRELIVAGRALRVDFGAKDACHVIAHAVAEKAALGEIRPLVCETLRKRDWSNFPHPGMGKVVYRPGDALPDPSPQRTEKSNG